MSLLAITSLVAHAPTGVALIEATAPTEYCRVCALAIAQHPRCFWCTVLLGPGHIEDVPIGWHAGDRRAIECSYCWTVRMRRTTSYAT
jgi:hypothetical protein